jgi:tetratricopeptide (TPR) repeat protein
MKSANSMLSDVKYIIANLDKKSVRELSQDLGLKERKIKKIIERMRSRKGSAPEPKPQEAAPVNKLTLLLSVLLIAILGFAVYANSINGQFIWDDYHLVKENVFITKWSNLEKVFTKGIREGAGRKGNTYRPMQMVTYMIDCSLYGLRVQGYHITNIIIHVLVALSIFWLISILFKNNLISLFTAALFVVHPVHTEAVSYISGRADPMALLFILVSLIFYIRSINSGGFVNFIVMASSYMCAILSKESSIILPVMIILYHYTFKKKFRVASTLAILGITLGYAVLRATFLKALLFVDTLHPTTLSERAPGFFVALINYLRLLFLPFPLHMEYSSKLFPVSDPRVFIGVVVLLSLITWGVLKRNSDRLVFFSISWFFITLMPVSNLYPVNAFMYEHWLYVPSIGFFLMISAGLASLFRKKELKIFAIVLIVSMISYYSVLTIRQNSYWQDSITFFKRTLQYSPYSARIYNDLGFTYQRMNKIEDAVASYKQAIRVDPTYPRAYYNLGVIYLSQGKYSDAAPLYKKLSEMDPSFDIYYKLSTAYINTGEKTEALNAVKKAIEFWPDNIDAYVRMGDIYVSLGEKEQAVLTYEKAIKINPGHIGPYINLGNIYVDTGRIDEGIAAYLKVIQLDPKQAMAYNNLAVAYYRKGDYPNAIVYCDRAVGLGYKVDPVFTDVLKQYRNSGPVIP